MLNQSKESRTSTDDLAFFVRIATLGSLTAAARDLGLSLAAVSKRLSQLERRLGVQLLKRTTRRLELTAEGRRYLDGARPLLDQLAALEEAVSSQTQVLRGTLNINASFGFGRRHVAPCVSAFAALHPELALSLQLSSQPLNFLDANVDIDVRVGEPPDSRLVARRLRTNPRILCCSPAYAARCGLPADIHALAQHNCILLRQHEGDFTLWRFVKEGESVSQKVRGSLLTNDGEVRCAWRWTDTASCCDRGGMRGTLSSAASCCTFCPNGRRPTAIFSRCGRRSASFPHALPPLWIFYRRG